MQLQRRTAAKCLQRYMCVNFNDEWGANYVARNKSARSARAPHRRYLVSWPHLASDIHLDETELSRVHERSLRCIGRCIGTVDTLTSHCLAEKSAQLHISPHHIAEVSRSTMMLAAAPATSCRASPCAAASLQQRSSLAFTSRTLRAQSAHLRRRQASARGTRTIVSVLDITTENFEKEVVQVGHLREQGCCQGVPRSGCRRLTAAQNAGMVVLTFSCNADAG